MRNHVAKALSTEPTSLSVERVLRDGFWLSRQETGSADVVLLASARPDKPRPDRG
jgi:hypothetical protein